MLPWGHLLRLAQIRFGLVPGQFWALSVLEWRLLLHPGTDHADRKTLAQLRGQFPDFTESKSNEPG